MLDPRDLSETASVVASEACFLSILLRLLLIDPSARAVAAETASAVSENGWKLTYPFTRAKRR